MRTSFLVVGAAALAAAHEDYEQTPLQGPHEGLWYNTLPGDGGTQVSFSREFRVTAVSEIRHSGRFCIFRHSNLWPSPVPSVSGR